VSHILIFRSALPEKRRPPAVRIAPRVVSDDEAALGAEGVAESSSLAAAALLLERGRKGYRQKR
jgi:hypothetical protein